MKKGEHTPGPWACSPNDDTATFPLEVWCRDDHRILVCRVQQHDPGAAQANAHLIAAAPDLLAACEALIKALDADRSIAPCDLGSERVAMEAAIKEARGEK